MSAKAFFDTNVLIYAFASNDPKGAQAEALLAAGGVTSVQTFNEFANVSYKKLNLEWSEIVARLDVIKALVDAPAPITIAHHEAARELASAHKLSFYDALIVASAKALGATILYSEDMQHDRVFGRLKVCNPFAA